MSIYSKAKKIYGGAKKIPIFGRFFVYIAPGIKKMLKGEVNPYDVRHELDTIGLALATFKENVREQLSEFHHRLNEVQSIMEDKIDTLGLALHKLRESMHSDMEQIVSKKDAKVDNLEVYLREFRVKHDEKLTIVETNMDNLNLIVQNNMNDSLEKINSIFSLINTNNISIGCIENQINKMQETQNSYENNVDKFKDSIFEIQENHKNILDSFQSKFSDIQILHQESLEYIQKKISEMIQMQEEKIVKCFEKMEEYEERVNAFHDRLEFVRLELLEESVINRDETGNESEHIIINQDKYDKILENGAINVNIGCGHKPLETHLNIDKRNIPTVDIVARASNLPFERDSINEIYAAHLVEHFTTVELEKNILPYWRDLLRKGGHVRIIVPDTPSMIDDYVNNRMRFEDLREVIFGLQDYDDDFHFTMFSPGMLKHLLLSSGFNRVELVERNRKNGKCREMELVAWK